MSRQTDLGEFMDVPTARRQVTNLRQDMQALSGDFRTLENLFLRYISLARRSGLPPDVMDAVARVGRLISILRTLHTTLIAINAVSAGSPAGLALAIAGVLSTGFMVMDEIGSYA